MNTLMAFLALVATSLFLLVVVLVLVRESVTYLLGPIAVLALIVFCMRVLLRGLLR